MSKIMVVINVELVPPWDDGMKVFARGLSHSLQRINGNKVEVSKLDGEIKGDYDYVHIVSKGSQVITRAIKNLDGAFIFKHIVTPAVGLGAAVKTNLFYAIADKFGPRLTKCFSSDFVAQSYFRDAAFIIPPSIDTTEFTNLDDSHVKISSILEKSETNYGIANMNDHQDGFVLYSGPLSNDRFPFMQVLDGIKEANSRIVIIGRNSTNDDAESLPDIIHYSRKIGIEDRVSIAVKTLSEKEKITIINSAKVIIQPFSAKFRTVAVDPPIFPLECMACCKPVITSKAYSLDSFITNEENGYIIDWSVPEQFASALSDSLNNDSLGINARNTIVKNFSIDAVAVKIKSMYNAVS